MILEIFFVVVLIYGIVKIKQKWQNEKDLPPGPKRLPIIGNLLQLALSKKKTPFEMLQELSEVYGPIIYVQFGAIHQVVLQDYNHVKEVLTNDVWVDRYYNEWFAQRSFHKILGVLMISGDVWKEMRRFSIRTLRDFGFGKQKSMETIIQEELAELTGQLQDKLEAEPTNGKTIKMKQFFTVSVLNILWNMIAGFRFPHDDAKLQQLLYVIDREIRQNTIGEITGPMYLYSAFPILGKILPRFTEAEKHRVESTELLQGFFRTILEERRSEGTYKVEQRDYIDVFLREIDAHKGDPVETNYYTDEQFIVVTMDLFLAGSETTSNTIEFAILYMILNPNIQKRVQDEIDQVIGQNRLPSILDKPNMPYTEATLLEVQRVANVLPIVVRSPNEATEIGGYKIPKGTLGVINNYAMHMDAKMWENPHEFNPSRFLNDRNEVINADKILPFGIGKRMCLGEILAKTSLFTFFTTFLQRFTFSKSPNHCTPTTEPALGFTLAPQPYHAYVTLRNQSN